MIQTIKALTLHLLLENTLGSLSESLKNKHFKEHPRVKASNELVTLEVHGNHDYYGLIWAGSEYEELRIIFDTTSQHTVLIDQT